MHLKFNIKIFLSYFLLSITNILPRVKFQTPLIERGLLLYEGQNKSKTAAGSMLKDAGVHPSVLKKGKTMLKILNEATYIGVASTEQAQTGYALESQRKKLREYAKMNNLKIVREFSDTGSGLKNNRQGYQEMLKFLDDSEDCKTILVLSADRLYRDLKTLCELQGKYEVVSVHNNANTMAQQLEVMFAELWVQFQNLFNLLR